MMKVVMKVERTAEMVGKRVVAKEGMRVVLRVLMMAGRTDG